jgi:glutathione S-transferase
MTEPEHVETLYVMHHSTCARKALFVMLEKGIELPTREVEREHLRTPAYRRLNPDGVVPTLVMRDGQPLVESSIIMRYLDDTHPGAPLQPTEPLARARMNLWMKWVDEKFFPSLQAITIATFMRQMFGVPPDEPRLQAMLASLTDHGLRLMREDTIRGGVESPFAQEGLGQVRLMLERIETSLANHAFLAGDELSLADCAVTPLVLRLEEFGLAGAWTSCRPRMTAWWRHICARPTLQQLVALADQKLLTELTGSVAPVRGQYLARLSE